MEITIKDKQYQIKYTIRALFIFEQIKKEAFALKTLTDYYLFFYCMLAANNPNLDLTFDELINIMDEDRTLIDQIVQFLTKEQEKNKIFGEDEKKKVMEKN